MKTTNSFKLIISCLALFITASSFAQKDFQGQAHYFSKTTIDMSNFGGREMSPDMKANIAAVAADSDSHSIQSRGFAVKAKSPEACEIRGTVYVHCLSLPCRTDAFQFGVCSHTP